MKKQRLTQSEVDNLVTVERVTRKPTMAGVGLRDVPFQLKIGSTVFWQYAVWCNMLNRCYSEAYKLRNPTYRDVTCCDEWLSFANFLEWCNKEVDYKGKPNGMSLDKDILLRGNKIYSPEACSFVPKAVNSLLVDSGAIRGKLPVGVCFNKPTGTFVVNLTRYGKGKNLGYFRDPQEAFACYKAAKEAQIKLVATQHKAVLKPAVFDSLMNWEIR